MDTRVFWGVLCALLVFSGLVVAGAALLGVLHADSQPIVVRPIADSFPEVMPPEEMSRRELLGPRWLCAGTGFVIERIDQSHMRQTDYRCAMLSDRRLR
ncbi:hypothetical protein [Dyella acidisoli]|uniref:Uncharacterized protein n=1 Tax=Dyella acidisoli TaxID=1867834 RepID=A0ABQ5XIZ7_9GAMM|nr:hypothetical protein [Dyella acidisoli]GLQ91597.1 hypothetical protein GCM10007901_05470 [Dyella acidisoli]